MIRALIRLLTLPIWLPLTLIRAASAFVPMLILAGIAAVVILVWKHSR